MSFGIKDIGNNISTKAQISRESSNNLLKKFLNIVIKESKTKQVKVHNFGTFYTRYTPQRLGRNPKTKEEFLISKRSKLFFKSSNKIRSVIN